MPSFDVARLDKKISEDIPDIGAVLKALAKWDVSGFTDIPDGSLRMTLDVKNQGTIEKYSGSWSPVTKLMHDVDKLDGYHASTSASANTIVVRDKNGAILGNILGNAATATEAGGFSHGVTLPVSQGGTGATTASQARTNLGVPPTSHDSTKTTHGAGNASKYGHVKLSDATNSQSGVSGGVAATPAAVKAAKDAADAAQSSANSAMDKASTLATSSTPGIVKPGTGMTVDTNGRLNVNTASTSEAGIVQLNNTVTSTSTAQAATAKAVKMAYDKAVDAEEVAGGLLPVGSLIPSFATSMSGYLLCNGATVSRTTYANLFSIIGTKFGAGDGTSTFKLPDFRNRVFWGASGNLMSVIAAGLPDHSHTIVTYGEMVTGAGNWADRWTYTRASETGMASASNNIYGKSTTVQPPAIAVNIFIKY